MSDIYRMLKSLDFSNGEMAKLLLIASVNDIRPLAGRIDKIMATNILFTDISKAREYIKSIWHKVSKITFQITSERVRVIWL